MNDAAAPLDRVAWLTHLLRDRFAPVHLEVIDESDLHRGHAGAAAGGGHFRVLIVSASFGGQSALARQRAVYAHLGEAMGSSVHALALRTLTPDEWQAERARQAAGARSNR
ncbi:MAG: BolA family protein [Candidatus Binatia bacterium]